MEPKLELWPNSGYRLLVADDRGHLGLTDDFLRAYLSRPEMAPVDESCDAERACHAALIEDPRRPVGTEEIARFADEDVRENYPVFLAFRDRLINAGTIEACYLDVFATAGSGGVPVPPLFVDQMAHVVCRHLLEGGGDPFRARAAELLFREQNATIEEGAILLGDTETVEMLGTTGGFGQIGKLLAEGGVRPKSVDLDVLQPETADTYWPRNERHDTVLDLTFARPGLDALCRILEDWVAHFTEARVSIQPVQQITDEKWVWHIGLDAEASALLNDLYNEEEVADERMERLLSLFRLEFADASLMRSDIAGRPVYLALCMTPGKRVRLKPQNLLVNLPLAAVS